MSTARQPSRSEGLTIQERLRSQQRLSTYIHWGHEAADEIDRLTAALAAAEQDRNRLSDGYEKRGKDLLDLQSQLASRDAAIELAKAALKPLADCADWMDITPDELRNTAKAYAALSQVSGSGLEARLRREGAEAAAKVAETTEVPQNYIWGDDAKEQFRFGARTAAANIRALYPNTPTETGETR